MLDINMGNASTRIERTVTIRREPGRTVDNILPASRIRKSGNSNLFGLLDSYCDRVFSEDNITGKGMIATVQHSLLDGKIAAEQLHDSLKSKYNDDIIVYDCDNITLEKIYSTTALYKIGKRLHLFNSKPNRHTTLLAWMLSVTTVIFNLFSVVNLIWPGITLPSVPIQAWILLFIITLFLLFFSLKRNVSVNKRHNFDELCEILKTMDTEKLDDFFENVGMESSLLNKRIYIFKRFDKVKDFNVVAARALLCYLRKAPEKLQIMILFSRRDVFEDIAKNPNFSKARLILDPLTPIEKKEIQNKYDYGTNPLNESSLRYFGVDAIVDKSLISSYHSKDEKELEDIIDITNNLKSSLFGCNPFKFVYLIAYFTSKYDIYLNKEEMEELFLGEMGKKGHNLSKEENEILRNIIDIEKDKKFACRELVSKACSMCREHIIVHRDSISGHDRYKFKRETEEILTTASSKELPDERDLQIWCLSKLLNPIFPMDTELRLAFCANIFVELSEHSFARDLVLLHKITSELLNVFETYDFFYQYETVFSIILDYMRRYSRFSDLCLKTNCIINANFHNLYYSVGSDSWKQHMEFTSLREKNISKQKRGETESAPRAFDILNITQENRDLYYANLIIVDDKAAIDYYDRLYQLYLASMRGVLYKSARLYLEDVEKIMPIRHIMLDIIRLAKSHRENDDYKFIQLFGQFVELIDISGESASEKEWEQTYLLCLLSVYSDYPLAHLLTSIIIYNVDNNAVITENLNPVLSFIQLGYYFRDFERFTTVDFGLFIESIGNSTISKRLKCAIFAIYIIFPIQYNDVLKSFLVENLDLTCSIIREAIISNRLDTDGIYKFLSDILLLYRCTERKEVVIAFVDSVYKTYHGEAIQIQQAVAIIVDKDIDTSIDLLALLSCWMEKSYNVAHQIYSEYVEKDNSYLSYLEYSDVIEILEKASLTGSFRIAVDYLCSDYCKQGEHLIKIFDLFKNNKHSCRTEYYCYKAMEVIDGNKEIFEPEEKNFFYERLIQIHNDQINRMKYSFSNPFMAISYNIFLVLLIRDKLEELHIAIKTVPSDESLFNNEAAAIHYIKNHYLDINAVNDNLFNPFYRHTILLIHQNNTNIQTDLNSIYGKDRILSHISSNAVALISLLLSSINKYGSQELSSMAHQLRKSLELLRLLGNTNAETNLTADDSKFSAVVV